jgi:hypothetical protein
MKIENARTRTFFRYRIEPHRRSEGFRACANRSMKNGCDQEGNRFDFCYVEDS